MKNLIFFLLVGMIALTSCDSNSPMENLTTLNSLEGTYRGILDSDDDDNAEQLLVVDIIEVNNDRYTVNLINDEGDMLFSTVAQRTEDQLNYGWVLTQTMTEETPVEIKYTLTYVDDSTLSLNLQHKYQYETKEFISTGNLTKD